MPPIADVAAKPNVRTTPSFVIRLHGPDRAGIEEWTGGVWDTIVEPKDDGLQVTVEIIKQNLESGVDMYVNVNNHYERCAPLTIRRLVGILRQS